MREKETHTGTRWRLNTICWFNSAFRKCLCNE